MKSFYLVCIFLFIPLPFQCEVNLIVPQENLGNIAHNETINAFFFLENTENSFIRIEKIKTSCGCIEVTKKEEWLGTNDKKAFHVAINPDPAQLGENFWFVRIYTSSSETPMLLVTFSANVLLDDIISVTKIELKKDSTQESKFSFWLNLAAKNITLSQNFANTSELLVISVKEKTCQVFYPGEKKAYYVEVSLKNNHNKLESHIHGSLMFSYEENGDKKNIEIPVVILL